MHQKKKKSFSFSLSKTASLSQIGTLSELLLRVTGKRCQIGPYYSSLLKQNGIPHDTKSLVHNKLSIWKHISKYYTAHIWYNIPCKNYINASMAEFGTLSAKWNNVARVGVLLNLVHYCTIVQSYHYLQAKSFFFNKLLKLTLYFEYLNNSVCIVYHTFFPSFLLVFFPVKYFCFWSLKEFFWSNDND